MIKFEPLLKMLIEKDWSNLTKVEKYKLGLMLQTYNIYVGGEELDTSDCSGTVSLALMMAYEVPLRTNAKTLFKEFFTLPENPNGVNALFAVWKKRKPRIHFGNPLLQGEASHIAGLIGADAVVNANDTGKKHTIMRADDVAKMFNPKDYDIVIHSLDENNLQKCFVQKHFWGADHLLEYFDFSNRG